jgi:hypothetical protein
MSDLFQIEPSFPSPLEKARRKYKSALLAYEKADTDETGQLQRDAEQAERVVRAMEAARLAR